MKDRLTSQTVNVPNDAAREIFEQLKSNGYSSEQISSVANQMIVLAHADGPHGERLTPDLGAGFSDYDLAQLGMPSE